MSRMKKNRKQDAEIAGKKFRPAIEQLIAILRIVENADLDHLVIERLASLAASMTLQVIQSLQMMVDGDKEGWKIIVWCDHVRVILSAAIRSSDAEAREAAIELVHRLGAMDQLEFRDLLPKSAENGDPQV